MKFKDWKEKYFPNNELRQAFDSAASYEWHLWKMFDSAASYESIEDKHSQRAPYSNVHVRRNPVVYETYTPYHVEARDGGDPDRIGPEIEVHVQISEALCGTCSWIGICNEHVEKHLSHGGYWGIRWIFHLQPGHFNKSWKVKRMSECFEELEEYIADNKLNWRIELA